MYEEQQGGSAEPEVIIVNNNTRQPIVVREEVGAFSTGNSPSGSTEESYASYQGH